MRSDTEGLRRAATISVWTRWCIAVGCLFEVSYRIEYGSLSHILNSLYVLVLLTANGYFHLKLRSDQRVNQRWLFALSCMDVAAVSFSTSLSGGFESRYFVMYYPAIAIFASVFTSLNINLLWVLMAMVVYSSICLVVEPGIDFQQHEEKGLFFRVLSMFAVAVLVNLVTGSERIGRRLAVERERELGRQRVELSQSIHDTTSQSAYLIGLGIDSALRMKDRSTPLFAEKLEATRALSKSAMWDLRLAIDGGDIFRGQPLGSVLRMHTESFTTLASVPAEFVLTGEDPCLSTAKRSLLFTIAHNALTNTYRHAQAHKVTVLLNFTDKDFTMLVCDDGVGLPEDYAVRGHGFRNMSKDAERLNGKLEIESKGTGTTVRCVVPYI